MCGSLATIKEGKQNGLLQDVAGLLGCHLTEKTRVSNWAVEKVFLFPCGGKCRLARGFPLCNIDPETYFQILRTDKQKYPIADRRDFQNHHWGW